MLDDEGEEDVDNAKNENQGSFDISPFGIFRNEVLVTVSCRGRHKYRGFHGQNLVCIA